MSPRPLKPSEQAARKRVAEWLSKIARGANLSDADIAVEMICAARKAELLKLGGRTMLTQYAPRKQVRSWRLGLHAPGDEGAYRLGESLRLLRVPRMSGFVALLKLGYASEVAHTLVTLSLRGYHLPALALFVGLRLIERGSDLQKEAAALVNCAMLVAGEGYKAAWDERYSCKRSPFGATVNCIEAIMNDTDDPSERTRLSWRLLIEWAMLEDANVEQEGNIPVDGKPEDIEVALVSLTLRHLVSSTLEDKEGILVRTLLMSLRNKSKGPVTT
jgi:hypothetical protein